MTIASFIHKGRSIYGKKVLFIFFLIFFLGIGGCGRKGMRPDLIFINGAEPETLDPAIITGQPESRIVSALFEGLMRFNSSGRAEPGVAERWEISADRKTYRFYLRRNACWSDGRPVTAHDFVASWKRVLEPATGAAYNYQLFFIKNARLYAEGKVSEFSEVGIRAINNQTLEVELENPIPFFLELCAFPTLFPVRLDCITSWGDNWIKPEHIVNNGAYRLVSWRINDRIVLRKNPHYWDRENVRLDSVEILPISKASTAINFYASGAADLILDKGLAPTSLLDELRKRPDFHSSPFLGTYFLRFNVTRAPFHDARVRKAFSICISNSEITRRITRGGEMAASGFVPPGLSNYSGVRGLGYSPEAARRLLAEAGYGGGVGLPRIVYLYSEGELNEAIAVELQSLWAKELGATVSLQRQEWKVYLNSLNSLDFSIARSSWVGDYPDANTFLDMFVTNGGNNRTGWSDARYDELIAAAGREADEVRRASLLAEAERILVEEECVIFPIFYYVGIQLYDPRKLGGIEGNLLDEHPIRAMYRRDRVGEKH
ncbi:MAG: peptide ABC transporter substrate-binding protein [Chthoniobacterales bacterium]|nr:peptide ABC transporter substrate-binding protein [Chthoniobacterales bacterium]